MTEVFHHTYTGLELILLLSFQVEILGIRLKKKHY